MGYLYSRKKEGFLEYFPYTRAFRKKNQLTKAFQDVQLKNKDITAICIGCRLRKEKYWLRKHCFWDL